MRNKVLLIGIIVVSVFACKKSNSYKQLNDLQYLKGDAICVENEKAHWLVDLKITNEKDSLILNTNSLGRKIEIHREQTDTASALIKVLSELCVLDSVDIIINADSFYNALGGTSPLNLDKRNPIKVKVWMRDKLNAIEYLAHKQVFENEGITRYIKKVGWNGQQDSNTLIYYEKLKTTQSEIVSFKKAKLKYVIKSLNENVIAYSQDDDPLIYDTADKSILRGIQFLAKKLAVGESLRAIVPSQYAFGPDGNSKVPGYMPILIELELVEILE